MEKSYIKNIIDKMYSEPKIIYDQLTSDVFDLTEFERKYLIGKCKLLFRQFEEGEKDLLEVLPYFSEREYLTADVYSDIALCKYRKNDLINAKQYLYKATELAELNNNYECKNRTYINLGVICINEKMYEIALEMYNKVDTEYLYSCSNKNLYAITLCNMAVLNYTIFNIESANEYKDKFLDYYNSCENKKNIIFYKNLILQAKNEAKGDWKKAIKYINKNANLNHYKYYEYNGLEERKIKAGLYKRLGEDKKALKIMLKTLQEASKMGYYKIILEMVEQLVSWGCEHEISRELCIDLMLVDIKKNNEEKHLSLTRDLEELQEKVYLKKALSKTEMDNEYLNKKISKLKIESKVDSLTLLYNRRYLESYLKQNMTISKKYITYAMLDLDNFKAVNDSKGHIFGDRVLFEIATIIKYSVDIIGKAFRYGGDEIFIIFEHNSLIEGKNILERIMKKVEYTNINESILNKVTLSIGAVTIYGGNPIHTREKARRLIVEKCDKLLYNSKRLGKNKLTLNIM
ncbi:MAG: tetratricopeptide repeat-containing diguanylate cyclase [Clostridium sp.]